MTISEILQFATDHFEVDEYIPNYEYSRHPNRNWIWIIINTACQEEFKQFIDEKISELVKYVVSKRSMNVKILPEFVNIFESAKSISTERGRTHFLLKTAGKRKWENIIKEDAVQLRNLAIQNQHLEGMINKMKEKIDEYAKNQDELLIDRGKLAKLYKEGIVDSDCEYKENHK